MAADEVIKVLNAQFRRCAKITKRTFTYQKRLTTTELLVLILKMTKNDRMFRPVTLKTRMRRNLLEVFQIM